MSVISPLAMNPVQLDCLGPAPPQIGRMADLTMPRPRTAGQVLDGPTRRCSVMSSDTARSHRRSIFLETGLLEETTESASQEKVRSPSAASTTVPEELSEESSSSDSPSSKPLPPRPVSSMSSGLTLDTGSAISLPKTRNSTATTASTTAAANTSTTTANLYKQRQSWSPGQFSDLFASSPRPRTPQPRLSPVSASSTSSASSTWSAWSGATAVSAATTATAATTTTTTTTATIVTTVTAGYASKPKKSWLDKLGDATWRKVSGSDRRAEPTTPTRAAHHARRGRGRVSTSSIYVLRGEEADQFSTCGSTYRAVNAASGTHRGAAANTSYHTRSSTLDMGNITTATTATSSFPKRANTVTLSAFDSNTASSKPAQQKTLRKKLHRRSTQQLQGQYSFPYK